MAISDREQNRRVHHLTAEFDGATYDPAFDHARLEKQLGRVYAAMSDRAWRTLTEISSLTGDPESSISARLRDLRKPKFGGYIINRRPRGDRSIGLFEYQLVHPDQGHDAL